MVGGSVSKWSVVGWSVVGGSVVGGFNKTQAIVHMLEIVTIIILVTLEF